MPDAQVLDVGVEWALARRASCSTRGVAVAPLLRHAEPDLDQQADGAAEDLRRGSPADVAGAARDAALECRKFYASLGGCGWVRIARDLVRSGRSAGPRSDGWRVGRGADARRRRRRRTGGRRGGVQRHQPQRCRRRQPAPGGARRQRCGGGGHRHLPGRADGHDHPHDRPDFDHRFGRHPGTRSRRPGGRRQRRVPALLPLQQCRPPRRHHLRA